MSTSRFHLHVRTRRMIASSARDAGALPPRVGDGRQPGVEPLRRVWSNGEFRALWVAVGMSTIGDQAAKIAVSVIVFAHTDSALAAAATLVAGFAPDLVAGPLLCHVADRYPRHRVMIVCDCARALVFLVMAIPALPVWLLFCLMLTAGVGTAPFGAARTALVSNIVTPERLHAAQSVMQSTAQLGQLLGNPVGAGLVAVVGPRGGILLDAASFGVSAIVLVLRVRPRAAVDRSLGQRWRQQIHAGFHIVATTCGLPTLIGLVALTGIAIVPEGLVVPLATQWHGGTAAIGVLWSTIPGGAFLGVALLGHFVPRPRAVAIMLPLAALTCASLIPTMFGVSLLVTAALWATSGVFSAYVVTAMTEFVLRVPDQHRGQAVGLAQAVNRAANTVGLIGAGAVAQLLSPAVAIGSSGVVGVLAAAGLALASAARRRSVPSSALPGPPPPHTTDGRAVR